MGLWGNHWSSDPLLYNSSIWFSCFYFACSLHSANTNLLCHHLPCIHASQICTLEHLPLFYHSTTTFPHHIKTIVEFNKVKSYSVSSTWPVEVLFFQVFLTTKFADFLVKDLDLSLFQFKNSLYQFLSLNDKCLNLFITFQLLILQLFYLLL